MAKLKVLFIGANPSPKNSLATVPFEGTQSGKTLDQWISTLGVDKADCAFMNVTMFVSSSASEIKKKDIRIKDFFFNLVLKSADMFHGQPLATLMMSAKLQSVGELPVHFERQSEEQVEKHLALIEETEMPKIIALGKLAAWAVAETGLERYELPHPSGRNRKLNDKDALQRTLEECRAWLYKDL